MNSNPPTAASIYSQNGGSTPTDESTSSESSVSEEAEQRAEEENPSQRFDLEQADDESEEQQEERTAQEGTSGEMRGHLNKDYRDLLNSAIEEAAGVSHPDSETLYPSQIGLSYWTSVEKDAFFHALAVKGRDDLPGIARATRTKSQIEVRSYLLALRNACSDDQVASPAASDPGLVDMPAAYEIGGRCKHAINLSAEALERRVLKRDVKREKRKFGELWLIDEDTAAQIELYQKQKELAAVIGDDEQEIIEISSGSSSDSDAENEVVEVPSDGEDSASKQTKILEGITAADLLKPEIFLQLSRSLFMNSAIDANSNWDSLGGDDSEASTPAMFRSAFDNFHNIAINYTRWIVQATMFQATSRLRAKDDQHPAAVVTTEDAKTAIDFLNLKFDREKYWSGVARRSCVEVYSDSVKFRDGRPGTRNGRLLTYDEVEKELGFPVNERPHDSIKQGDEDQGEEAQSKSSEERSEVSDEEDDEQSEVSSTGLSKGSNRRKRAASASSDEDEEDERLNEADEQASRAEERRLIGMLRYCTSPSPDQEPDHAQDPKHHGRRKRLKLEQQDDWREHVNYMEPWEQQRIWMEQKRLEEERGE